MGIQTNAACLEVKPMQGQFDIGSHYNVMAELDQDVHDDVNLATSEVKLALQLIGHVPRKVFLPCFGTGRHIQALLDSGVQSVVGVDLSMTCVAKALEAYGHCSEVSLLVGDVCWYRSAPEFDAVLLLGNSFGDIIDPNVLKEFTAAMTGVLRNGGVFVMDYIGTGYQCQYDCPTTWNATLNGRSVHDIRTPQYDPTGILTIHVNVRDQETSELAWQGCYQKRVMSDSDVVSHFASRGVNVSARGVATHLNPYYSNAGTELGMIAKSTWWVGEKS